MTSYPELGTDAASRLWWAVRRYLLLLILLPVLGGIAGAVVGSAASDEYEASALIVATPSNEGDTRSIVEQLPNFAFAVFANGQVAERAVGLLVAQGAVSPDWLQRPDELIEDYVELEPIEQSLAIRVKGLGGDARLAAQAANRVAMALVAEMNSALAEVATFKVQELASVPQEPLTAQSGPKGLMIGVLAGLLFAAGIASLLVLVRRPVLGADEATEIAGVPVIGTPRLPRRAGRRASLETPGLGALIKRLSRGDTVRCAFVSCRGGEKDAVRLASLTTHTLARKAPVVLVATGEGATRLAAAHVDEDNVEVVDDPHSPTLNGRRHVVIGGLSARHVDVSQVLPEETAAALVVREGVTQSAVEDAASQFADGDLAGVIFVRRR